MSITTALVVGGGIAGPTTAIALRRAGIAVTVCEAYPGPSDGIGSTLAIAPNGMAALDVIGAGDAVRAIAIPIIRTAVSIGHAVIDLPGLSDLEPQQMVDRGDLYRVLRERAVDAGVVFEYGRRLVSAGEEPDGITAVFADGTTATADVLIGADGVHSTVRTLIDPNAPGAGYTGLLGFGAAVDVRLDAEPGLMHFAFGSRAYYLYWVLPDGRTAWG
ncbi:FAD-dependent oxidoreductase [Tsukamurella soli]